MGSRYFLRKVTQALATIVLIVLFNFLLFRLMPGSPERVLLRNPHLTAATVADIRARWGLDKPLFPDQLVASLGSPARGVLGSWFKFGGEPVVDVLGERIWPTIILFGLGEAI